MRPPGCTLVMQKAHSLPHAARRPAPRLQQPLPPTPLAAACVAALATAAALAAPPAWAQTPADAAAAKPFTAVTPALPAAPVSAASTTRPMPTPTSASPSAAIAATLPQADLPPIVVQAVRGRDASTLTQPDLPTARRRMARVPGGAAVVDAESYAQARVSNLADALGWATGVFVQPRFGAEEARLSIRGSGLQRTFHGRGIKLMQDGVPLNLADGSFDFQAVEPLSARYVEVWRGANALQWGATTLGGAINFVSPNGYNGDRARARLEAGSWGYRRLHLSTGDVAGPIDYHLAVSQFTQEGYRDHAAQDTRRVSANIGWQPAPRWETRVYLGHVKSDSDLPGSLTLAQLAADPRQAAPGNLSGDQQRDIEWTRISNKTVWRGEHEQVEAFFYASDKRLFHPIFQVLQTDSRDRGLELRYTTERPLAGRGNRFTVGASAAHGTNADDRFVNLGGQPGARTNAFAQTARNVELYAENEHRVQPDLGLVIGWQLAESRRESRDRYIVGGVDEGFDLTYRGSSPKLGLVWDARRNMQVFANVSRSFEPPSFSEITGGTAPVLNHAQRGTTLELGTRGKWGGPGHEVEWDVAVYEAHLRNELLSVSASPSVTTTINAGRTVHRGLEAGASGKAPATSAGRLEWQLNALWNDFRLDGDATLGNRRLPGLPEGQVRAQLGWRLKGGTLVAVNVEAATQTEVSFDGAAPPAAGYAIWGLKAAGQLTPQLAWFIEGRNLADKTYVATTGVVRSRQAWLSNGAQYMPGDGRSVYAGVDWRFN